MESKFKVGDRIVCNGFLGRVINVDDSFAEEDELYYDVEWDDGEVETVKESDIEPIDLKTAFLSELKGLLEKYDARIGCNPVHDDEFEICIDFKGSMVSYPSYIQWLNAGYVSHFKKE